MMELDYDNMICFGLFNDKLNLLGSPAPLVDPMSVIHKNLYPQNSKLCVEMIEL